MRVKSFKGFISINESYKRGEYITLRELYGEDIPHRQEMIWSYLNKDEYDEIEFKVVEINPLEWFESIRDSYEEAEEVNAALITYYRNNIDQALKDPIVIESNSKQLIDGHHRIVAMAKEGVKKAMAVDLWEERED